MNQNKQIQTDSKEWKNEYLHKQEINRKSNKIHLIWLVIFAVFIGIASWIVHG